MKLSRMNMVAAPLVILTAVILCATFFKIASYEKRNDKTISPTPSPSPDTSPTPSPFLSPTPTVKINPPTPTITPTTILTITPLPKPAIEDLVGLPQSGTITNTNYCPTVKFTKQNDSWHYYLRVKVDDKEWTQWDSGFTQICVMQNLGAGPHVISAQLLLGEFNTTSAEVTRDFVIVKSSGPKLEEFLPPAEGAVLEYKEGCFLSRYRDDVYQYSDNLFRFQFDSEPWGEWKTDPAYCFQTMSNGPHTIAVQAKNKDGTESGVTVRHFSVAVSQ